MTTSRFLAISLLYLALCACSAQQVQIQEALVRTSDSDSYVLQNAVVIEASRAKDVTLRAGTRWRRIGRIGQGNVFDTDDQVVIVNSFDVHEASIVVHDAKIVGYYLAVEKTFVECEPVNITLIEE